MPKATDRKDLAKTFYPYIHFSPRGLKQGQVMFTFAARQPAQSAARLNVDLRGGSPAASGPSLSIERDGTVKAGRQTVCKLQPGTWTQFEIRCPLDGAGQGTYTLNVRNQTAATSHTLPFASAQFKRIDWIGFTLPDDADGAIYLDQLKLQITK